MKTAAGPGLRHLLTRWTDTPLRGVLAGFLMTAIVQSSSAVTVASLGFVNAGLINLHQVLGVIFGANIGTTMTGWLVALLGFEVNIQAFALPLIGIGMLLKLMRGPGQLASAGVALVGFGLFFIGIGVLKQSFEGIVETFSLTRFTADGMSALVIYLLLGVLVTTLTQSSSASIAITITAASSGVIGLYAAAAMVVGANVGTTSTAVFAAIGATSAAKRAAAAQVLFNLITAVVAMLILPVLFYLINSISALLSLDPDTGITLALFHTLFNLLGLLLIFPFMDNLARWLEQRFKSWEETESHPRFLDNTIAQTPALAVNALLNELDVVQQRFLNLYQLAISPQYDASKFRQQRDVLNNLARQISRFIVNLESAALPDETTEQLATLMRVEHYLVDCTLSADTLAASWNTREKLRDPTLESELAGFLNQVYNNMVTVTHAQEAANSDINSTLDSILQEKDRIKATLIMAGTRHQIEIAQMSSAIDSLQEAWHITKTWHKATHRVTALAAIVRPEMPEPEPLVASQ
ncbi:Na/Pi cotransporter family protein [Alteromonas aestuariivivens]|uniref:Na/Pi cotransporter family protein n=1 Tax=Alteromonas aestuariivivens TaxID=1938339 RepID=UPI001FE75ADA|nr:Na/Pi symporter [Alteromonas aestuariivivens]